jgi:hypothetical protein
MLLTRPQRSATSEIGTVSRPTTSETTLTRLPSCESDSPHSALSDGMTAPMTWRDR